MIYSMLEMACPICGGLTRITCKTNLTSGGHLQVHDEYILPQCGSCGRPLPWRTDEKAYRVNDDFIINTKAHHEVEIASLKLRVGNLEVKILDLMKEVESLRHMVKTARVLNRL